MEHFPKDRPVILVANHQNAMMDPMVLCVETKPQLHWLTRADIFKKPFINKLLRNLNMLPVYRERDRVTDLSAYNQLTFDTCNERLKEGAVVCLFPEGSHRGKKQLVPLKKGVVRLALNTLDSGIENGCIVPVGLDYEDFYNYRKNLLIMVGKPIDLAPFKNGTDESRSRAQTELMKQIRLGLESVMIDFDNDHIYKSAMNTRPLFDKLSGSQKLEDQFRFFQAFTEKMGRAENPSSQAFEQSGAEYSALLEKLQLNEKYFCEDQFPVFVFWGWILLALPAFIAFIVFSPIYYLIESVVKKVVRDRLFMNSVRAGLWTFLVPLWLFMTGMVTFLITKNATASFVFIALLISSGILALKWWPLWKMIREWALHRKLKKSRNAHYTQWLKKREELKHWITGLVLNK